MDRGCEILADRLLNHHPRFVPGKTVAAEPFADGTEQLRRSGEVIDLNTAGKGSHRTDKLGPPVLALGVDRDEQQARQEAVELWSAGLRGRDVFDDGVARERDEFVMAHRSPRRADNGRGLRQLAVEIAMKQRRQQLATRKIAGRAEHYQDERSHRDHAAGHASPFLKAISEISVGKSAAERVAWSWAPAASGGHRLAA